MDLGLEGKRAIVTGGSKGIGRRVVDLLAAEGCDVAFCARDKAGVDDTVTANSNAPGKVTGAAVDVSDDAALRAWIAEAGAAMGGIDIVVANASSLVVGADAAAWQKGLDVDVLGTVRTVEAAMPFLETSKSASIVGIASTAAVQTARGVRAYSGIKAAIVAYLSGLSNVAGTRGIRANCVSPGAIEFPGGNWERRKTADPATYNAALARSPFGRLGTAEEVANAVVFLASPAASYISGTNLVVDGAATTRIQY